MRKTLWIFTCLALIIGSQAGARMAALNPSGAEYIVENARVPSAPKQALNPTDEVVFFEDFESGAVGWEYWDLSNVSSWHVDDFNAYGGSGMSWWAGDSTIGGYDNHWLQFLVSPTLDLSGATNPTLTFQLFYAVEELTGGYPAPYDGWDGCNVWVSTDDGANWDVLDMISPAYPCTSMYSFGVEWGMGPGIAGWGGFSGGVSPGVWLSANTSLTGYTTSTVKIRFALCSDPVWCTLDQPELTGMFVDNILIREGTTTYLQNNAQGIAIPSDLIPTPGMPPTGNFWHLSQPIAPTPPSPTHVMEMSDGAGSYVPDIYNAVVSPVIDLTTYDTTGNATCDFYVRGSINVNDPNPFPDVDTWTVQIRPVGYTAWFYYSNPWNTGTTNYVITSVPTNYSLWSEIVSGGAVDLSPYLGYEVQVRILFMSDPDNYFGEGILVDDFIVEYTQALDNDCGADKMLVPMPTSTYFSQIHCSVELHNYGLNNQSQVPAFWRVNYGTPNPFLPWASIPSGSMVLKEWDWTTPVVGNYFMDSYTQLFGDENLANDTSKAGLVEVTPDDVFELGYDNRQYSYESFYYFLFDPGEGPYIRYTPQDDGINFNLSGQHLKAMFHETGAIRIHIYQAGTPTTPGPEVTSWDATITQTSPNWQTFDISGVSYLQNNLTDFWVHYELIQAEQGRISGDDLVHGEGHFFADFGTGMQPSVYDFFARAVFAPAGVPNVTIDLTYVSGSPVPAPGGPLVYNVAVTNNETTAQTFDAWIAVTIPTGAEFVLINRQLTMPAGGSASRQLTLNVPGGAPAGSYTMTGYVGDYPAVIWDQDSFDFTKSGDGDGLADPTTWVLDGWDEPWGTALPEKFAVLGNHPNPFNPVTTISYTLPEAGKVTLAVYDVSGRLVSTLVDGYRDAGVHQVTFDASQLASGIYVYRLSAGNFTSSGKMVLMK